MSVTGVLPTYQRFVNGVPVSFTRRSFRAREKYVIFLVFVTFGLVCFGTFFFLPEFRTGGTAESVYRVYDKFKRAGPELLIPPPPILEHDPHLIGDREKLRAKIEQDGELKVLERPDIGKPKTSSTKTPHDLGEGERVGRGLDDNVGAEDLGAQEIVTVPPAISDHYPLTRGGEETDPVAKERREQIKKVR